ncbi:MAG: hypothetical protein IKE21_02180 [Erysipelotrichaceae bacterium]|nr:hypothetical protein [Erysipelotrichaceae bacterium]
MPIRINNFLPQSVMDELYRPLLELPQQEPDQVLLSADQEYAAAVYELKDSREKAVLECVVTARGGENSEIVDMDIVVRDAPEVELSLREKLSVTEGNEYWRIDYDDKVTEGETVFAHFLPEGEKKGYRAKVSGILFRADVYENYEDLAKQREGKAQLADDFLACGSLGGAESFCIFLGEVLKVRKMKIHVGEAAFRCSLLTVRTGLGEIPFLYGSEQVREAGIRAGKVILASADLKLDLREMAVQATS